MTETVTVTDATDRCGFGRPHDQHTIDLGRFGTAECAGLTIEVYEAKRELDRRYEAALAACPRWSPVSGCSCEPRHDQAPTPGEVFGVAGAKATR